jgi:hypothetical protein
MVEIDQAWPVGTLKSSASSSLKEAKPDSKC